MDYDGTPGADQYFGTPEDDVIHGGGGQDQLRGAAGNDTIEGGDGPDSLYGDLGDDVIDGGAGDDVIRGGKGDDVLRGGSGFDVLAGDRGDDFLFGGDDRSILLGGPNDDTIYPGAGAEVIDGGDGYDTVDYTDSVPYEGYDGYFTGVFVYLSGWLGEAGHAFGDSLFNVEVLIGTSSHDYLDSRHNDSDDSVYGAAGSDVLVGSVRDYLEGGPGDDRLWVYDAEQGAVLVGGPGEDRFIFSGSTFGGGEIRDFTKGEDQIRVRFTDLRAGAKITSDFRYIGSMV